MPSVGETRVLTTSTVTGVTPTLYRFGDCKSIVIFANISATASIDVRVGGSGAHAGALQGVVRAITGTGPTHIPYPCPELSFNVTANTGNVDLWVWGVNQ